MTPEDWPRLKLLFRAVMERPASEREAFIAEAFGDDQALRNELSALVRAAEEETDQLEHTAAGREPSTGDAPAIREGSLLLGRFHIVRFLGSGGMGEVYEANDLELGRIALKTLLPEIANNPRMLARFRHEVQCARKATGRNVCRIHELFIIPGDGGKGSTAFLTMEFLEGKTLARRIHEGPLSPREVETIALELCAGLRTIHEASVVHGDFKSRNVMLANRNGKIEAVVTDFGLARQAAASAAVAGSGSTVAATVAGTPEYMAPEQFEAAPLSPRTDIYALGIVLYEMLTGKLPFSAHTPLGAAAQRAKHPIPVSSIRRGLSRHWDRVIDRCLQYEPQQRYQSTDEVVEALLDRRHWITKLNRTFAEIDAKRRTVLLLIVGLICAIAGGLTWFLMRGGYRPPSPQAQHWYNDGVTALREGTYLKATSALERAVKLDSRFVLAHARLADAWNELDFTSKAKDEMLQASSLELGSKLPKVDKEYVEAVRDTMVRDFPAAVDRYQAIFKDLPQSMKAYGYVDLGRAYEKAGDIKRAIDSYSAAAKLDPEYPASFVRLGILESREKNTAEADAAFDHAESLYRAGGDLEGIAEIEYQRGNDANTQLHLTEARSYLEKSLRAAQAIPSVQLEVRALTRLSTTEYLSGNAEKSTELATKAIELAQRNGIEYWAIDGLIRLGYAYFARGDYGKADSYFHEAFQLARESRRPRLVALAEFSLASTRNQQSKPEEVIPLAQAAVDYYKPAGFLTESANALTLIVRAKRDKADFKDALESARSLLDFAAKSKNEGVIMGAQEALGSVLLELQQYPEALDHFQTALAISRELHQQVEYHSLRCADTLWRLGRYENAEEMISPVSPRARRQPNIATEVEEITAAMRLSQRRYAEALQIARQALAGEPNSETGFFERLSGNAELALGFSQSAQRSCRKALSEAQGEADREAIAESSLALAAAYEGSGLPEQAKPLADAALAFFSSSGQRESEYRGLLCMAKICLRLGDSPSAKKFARQGIDILASLEHNWSPQAYKAYLTRPDVAKAQRELQRLADIDGVQWRR